MVDAHDKGLLSVDADSLGRTLNYQWVAKAESLGAEDVDGMTQGEFFRHRQALIKATLPDVLKGTYRPAVAKRLMISADKPRAAYRFRWIDHFWLDHLALKLREACEPHLSDSLMSFRKGRSPRQALQRVSRYLKAANGADVFIVRRDVRNYGPSMEHERMLGCFDRVLPECTAARELFRSFCSFRVQLDDGVCVNESGLPAGTQLQTVFDNLYLSELDAALDSVPNSLYLRFGDDILFATRDLDVAERTIQIIARQLHEASLVEHPDKRYNLALSRQPTRWVGHPLVSPAQVLTYLGMQVDLGGVRRLPREKLRRVTSHLRSQLRSLVGEALASDEIDARIHLGIQVIKANLRHGLGQGENPLLHYLPMVDDEAQLRELDLWIAQEVLSVATRRGHKKSNFRRFPYGVLRALGLPSLVHERRKNEARSHV